MTRYLKLAVIAAALAAFGSSLGLKTTVESQDRRESRVDQVRRERFRHNGVIQDEEPAREQEKRSATGNGPSSVEAPTGYDSLTNGYIDQGPPYSTINEDNVAPLAS